VKIYTKTGDSGETGLFGGRRLPKNDARIEAYGTVDELNSFIGLLRDSLEKETTRARLREIQDRLFTVGSHLACDPEQMPMMPDLKPEDILILEQEMDEMTANLPELRHFLMPGGHAAVSVAHVCRTVCRRAERCVVELANLGEPVEASVLTYLNRLSDYFFVLSRQICQDFGVAEEKWMARKA
jgi:cob(I)alamin adenosyltransferase